MPRDSLFPVRSIAQLDGLLDANHITSLNEKRPTDFGNILVIYSFRGCKRCAILARELNKKIVKGKLRSNQIVYINTQMMSKEVLQECLKKQEAISPYYIKDSYCIDLVDLYPRIDAFDKKGELVWTVDGYKPSFLPKIKTHLTQ